MRKRFKSYKAEVTNKEAEALPIPDRVSLFQAMRAYQDNLGVGYVVKTYQDHGVKMLKPSNKSAGRCIYFVESESDLVVLTFYKKESNEAPKSVLERAKSRKKEYKDSHE